MSVAALDADHEMEARTDAERERQHRPRSASASVSASVSRAVAAATTSPSPKSSPKERKKPVLDPTQLAAVQALIDYRLCQNYTALTKAGKTLDPKALALLVKAAGSSTPTAIAAYCAALPVPPSPCLAQPMPTASPSPSTTPSAGIKRRQVHQGWRLVALVRHLPEGNRSPSPTPTASATATADRDGDRGNHFGVVLVRRSRQGRPLGRPERDPQADAQEPFPGQQNWFGNWGSGQGNNGQGGGQRDGTPNQVHPGQQPAPLILSSTDPR